MTRPRWWDDHPDALAREDAVRRQRAAWVAYEREVRERAAVALLAALRDPCTAAGARLDVLDRLAVRCSDCGCWTLTVSPRLTRRAGKVPAGWVRVNGRPVRAHRCSREE